MQVTIVEKYGGEWEDAWQTVDKCFNDTVLAKRYIALEEAKIAWAEERRKKYMELYEDLDEDYFTKLKSGVYTSNDYYRTSFDKFLTSINNLQNKEKHNFSTDDLKKLYNYYIKQDMEWAMPCKYRYFTMHIETHI